MPPVVVLFCVLDAIPLNLSGTEGNATWFDDGDGRITVKNPDEEILSKMRQITRHFGARVIDDDGEEYT